MLGPRLAALLIVTLALPILFSLGPLRLTPYRLLILATFVPLFFTVYGGRLGKVLLVDWLLLFAAIWSVLAIMVVHGFAFGLESGGIFAAEFLGGYLIGRVCIRSAAAFRQMTITLFLIVCALAPFGFIEAMTDQTPLLRVFNAIGRSYPNYDVGVRLNMHRSQVVFEHPILYGCFCASCLGIIYYFWSGAFFRQVLGAFAVCVATIFSVSTGAIVAILMQTLFVGWELVLKSIKARWRILTILFIAAYIVVDILSNRSPFHVFIDYLTFSSGSGFNRIRIFEFGTAEVGRYPFFGIGYNEWERPSWMGSSVDNFWLLNCMRYGLPMGGTLMVVVFLIMRRVCLRSFRDRAVWACQAGFLTAQGGLIIAAGTVHFWNAILVWYMCFLGAGVWLITHQETAEEDSAEPEVAPKPRYRSLGREGPKGLRPGQLYQARR